MKKYVSMLVIVAMLLSMVPNVFAADANISGTKEEVNNMTTTETPTTPDGSEDNPYIIESLPAELSVTFDNEDKSGVGVFYQYTAEKDGYLKLDELDGYTMTGCLYNVEGEINLNEENLPVTKGETYTFNLWAVFAGKYGLTLQYSDNTETDDGDDTDDTENDKTEATPDSGEWSGTDVEVAADENITIVHTPETNGTLSVAVSCETGWKICVTYADSEEASWSDIDDSPVSFKLTAGVTYTIVIEPYDEADGFKNCDAVMTYELTWTAESTDLEVEGSGTDEDPYVLKPNADNHAVIVGDGSSCDKVYFCWTATADGTLTLTFDETDPAPYVTIYVNSLTKTAFQSDQDQWTARAELAKGDYVYIVIETYKWESADYTFYASFGSEDDTVEDTSAVLTDGDNSLTILAGQGTVPYTYTATQSGTLYLTFTYFASESIYGLYDYSDAIGDYFGTEDGYDNWMKLTINGVMAETYYGSVQVAEGDVVSIGWEYHGANNYVQSNYNLYATLNLNYDGFAIPEPGSIDDPYEMYMSDVEWGYGTTNEVASGASVFYELYNFYDSIVTLTGKGDFTVKVATYDYDEDWNEILVWTEYPAKDGYVEFYADSYSILVEIVNNSDAAAAYAVGYYYPTGHTYNPQVISGEGQWTVSLDANSNGYYFRWSVGDATKTGIMTITVGGESWEYYVGNDSQYKYGDTHTKSNDGIATENWNVFAGNLFTICVSTEGSYDENWNYTSPAGEITVTVTFKEQELVQGVDYPYVVSYYDELPAEITVGAGKNVWVELDYLSGYYVVIKGEGASLTYNDVVYTDEDGDGTLMVAISDNTANVTLGNTSDADVTYSINYEAPLGHSDNPQAIIDDGTYTSSEFTANGLYNYYFKYTATENGTITVKVLNEGGWRCYIQNKATYASAGGNSTYVDSTITMKVNAGDTVLIYGAPYENYTVINGVLSFNFSFEKEVLDTDNATPLDDGNNAVEMDNTDTLQTTAIYTYTATQSGKLYLTLSDVIYYTYSSYSGNMNGPYAGRDYLSRYTNFLVNGEALSGGYYGTVEVEKGDVITITWVMKYNYAWKFDANLNLSYEGYDPAPGSEADPIQVSFSDCYQVPVQTIEIAAGSTAHYILRGFDGYTLTITGEGAYLIYNGVTYTAENGVIELVGDAYEMTVQIGNSGDAAATFEISGAFPVGHQMNPEKITEGDHSVTVDANDENYFVSYTPDCDGIMTITVSGDSWTFMIYNAFTGMCYYDGEWSYWGGWYYSSDYNTNTITIEIEVWAGEEIQIGVNTEYTSDDPEGLYGSSPAGTISLNVATEFFHADKDEDGCCDICKKRLNLEIGDVNGDGLIDLSDVNLVIDYFNGVVELTEDQMAFADVNNDGEIDIFDANMIVGYMNGTVAYFPADKD